MGLVVPRCQACRVKFQFCFYCGYMMAHTTHCTPDQLFIYTVMWSMGTNMGPELTCALKRILTQECGLFKSKHHNFCLLQIWFAK